MTLVTHDELVVEDEASIVVERHIVGLSVINLEAVLEELGDVPEHAGKVSRVLQNPCPNRWQILAQWPLETIPDVHLQLIVPIVKQFQEPTSSTNHSIGLGIIGLKDITRVVP